MGKAAYDRGTKAIRQQIDAEQSTPLAVAYETIGHLQTTLDQTKAELAAVKAELETARAAYARRVAERDCEREERRAAELDAHLANERVSAQFKSANQYRQQWLKASALLRMFTPEQVQEARIDAKIRYPELWEAA